MHTIDALLAGMVEESDLFRCFADKERELTRVVQKRDWEQLQGELASLEVLARRIEETEHARHGRYCQLKGELGLGDRAGFDLVLQRLPEGRRADLARGQTELKNAVSRVRSITASLAYYFRYIRDSVEQILEEVFPHKRGRLYGRNGATAATSSDPVVLNRQL
jgi:hypothetical protein